MRPIRSGEQVVGGHLVEKQSLAAVRDAWNTWEIHCLLLLSLFLQMFLFLTAGLRRRSTSTVLRTVVWLAYLLADAVAIFVLGHLAVHASEPRHQLMSFWAPFVLVHLGGQDTITAFSKQDNELWMRHLLSLVTQVAVAGYVVAKASWPDRLLRSAMVLMFLSGCFKYAERTLCLYISNPASLRSAFQGKLSWSLEALRKKEANWDEEPEEYKLMLQGSTGDDWTRTVELFVDVPPNTEQSILAADSLPGLLQRFRSNHDRFRAYVSVGAYLVNQYKSLYTKYWQRRCFYDLYTKVLPGVIDESIEIPDLYTKVLPGVIDEPAIPLVISLILLYPLFVHFSALVALVLFTVAEKGGQLHTSRADVTVSYILLVGAMALDVSSVTMFFSSVCTSSLWSRKQWSEELGQYSMIKRHVVQDTTGVLSSMRQWIGRQLGDWGVGLLELTHTPITQPVKELILDSLLLHGTRKEWHVASSRGLLAVQNWKKRHQYLSGSKSTAKALEKTTSSVADFPTSVLIWHLATDICYYYSGDADNTTNNNHSDYQVKKKDNKELSRQISNYIMYLVFKCGVKLTPNSQHLHDKSHDEIREILSDPQHQQRRQVTGGEKAAFMKIFEARKTTTQQKHEKPAAPHDTAGDNHVQKLLRSAEAFDSPLLPRARELAHMLISINEGEADCWSLIATVWSEMLYYAAPRCGGAFHYEHLSTGGEFATHVLVLMRKLGPFMPPPDDPA